MFEELKLYNSKNELITLNSREKAVANHWERTIKNSLGYEISITSLTTIMKKINE